MQIRSERAIRIVADQTLAYDHLVEAGSEHAAVDKMNLIVHLEGNRQDAAKGHVLTAAIAIPF